MISHNGIIQHYTVSKEIRNVQSFFWEKGSDIRNFFNLPEINRRLASENLSLLRKNVRYGEIIDSINHAGRLVPGIKEDSGGNFVFTMARVIKNSLGSSHNFLIINKGSADGIEENMGVLTPCGVIGITRAVGRHNTFVYSFLNAKQTLSVQIGHSNLFGPLTWNQTDLHGVTLSDIQIHIPVNKGDTLFTSGYSSLYPAGIPIAIIENSSIKNGIKQEVGASLIEKMNAVNYVFVARNIRRKEIDSLGKAFDKKSNEK
ncbi:MAG: rod shape-determining protein MreC [Bacteroidales bacterium]|jgi:rod shape-determining protein MreC|nr:rod shape-determining protein MreC [Bacteroidales bacterium]